MPKPDVCPTCRGAGTVAVRTVNLKTGTYTLSPATCRDCGGSGRRNN